MLINATSLSLNDSCFSLSQSDPLISDFMRMLAHLLESYQSICSVRILILQFTDTLLKFLDQPLG